MQGMVVASYPRQTRTSVTETLLGRSGPPPHGAIVRWTPPDVSVTGPSTSGALGAIRRNRKRILISSVNGLVAFLFGLSVETAFMRLAGVGHFPAYVLQIAFSTQLSFLLARYVTWRDRRVHFFRTLAKYNTQQLATILLSIVLFAGLNRIGLYYAVANLTVTITVAPLTFFVAHNWSMAERRCSGADHSRTMLT
jgi:putative flippase GtrA